MDMRHANIPYVFLILLFPLLSSALHSHHPSEVFLSNASIQNPPRDSSLESLPILQDPSGLFYIDVTWKNASVNPYYHSHNQTFLQNSNDDSSKNDGKMVLALYTNQSFVADAGSNCNDFLFYNCDELDCQTNSYDLIDSSYLIAGTYVEGHSIDIGMQSPAFNMCGYSVMYATSCAKVFVPGFSGYLGMGFSMNAFFEVNRNFSIFLSDGNDGLSNTLFVGADNNDELIDSSSNFTQQWNTDKNWTVTINDIQAQVEDGTEAFRASIGMNKEYKVLFDINTNAIAMPIELYNSTILILNQYGASCLWAPTNISCQYSGAISSLPTFYFTIEDQNATAIEIKPQIYFYHNKDDSYTLMFAAISSNIPGSLLLNPEYMSSIILGQPFLTFYYVHFSICQYYVQPFVTLYYAKHTPSVVPTSSRLFWILGGVGLLLLIIIIIVAGVIIRKRRKAKIYKNKLEEERTTIASSGRRENESVTTRNMNSALQQPLISRTLNTNQETPVQLKNEEVSQKLNKSQKKEKTKVWSNDHVGYEDPNEITAYTYKKQKFRGLYESGADSFSLNDDVEMEN